MGVLSLHVTSHYHLRGQGIVPRNYKQLWQTKRWQGHFSPLTYGTEITSNTAALDSRIYKIKAQSFGSLLRKFAVRLRPDVRDHVMYADDYAYSLICKYKHKTKLITKPKVSRYHDLTGSNTVCMSTFSSL